VIILIALSLLIILGWALAALFLVSCLHVM